MNEFKFKIPEELKEEILSGNVSFGVVYRKNGLDASLRCVVVTATIVNNVYNVSALTWKSTDSISFEKFVKENLHEFITLGKTN